MESNATIAVSSAPDWRALLAAEVETNPKGKAGVAIRLGVSRAYVSRALSSGSAAFKAVPPKFIARVIDRLHVIPECPATGQPQPRSDCMRIGNGAAPTHNPLSMRIWIECQRCPHKPANLKEPQQ